MAERFELRAAGQRLEAAWYGPRPADGPVLVLLHEGLGCVDRWRAWPERLSQETGLGVMTYSRLGYGRSDAVPLPRPIDYMQDEGERVLPQVLDAAGITRAILIGHSDGGSIAIVHAANDSDRVMGVVLLAAHVFCEDLSVASISRARDAFVDGDLRARLERYHGDNVDCAFWGWNRAWLDPEFRKWNIERYLPRVAVPALIIQGEDDPYGTLAQVDAIERGIPHTSRLVLPACGHAPHQDRPAETTRAVVDLVEKLAAGA